MNRNRIAVSLVVFLAALAARAQSWLATIIWIDQGARWKLGREE